MAEKSAKLLSMTEEELNARHADKMRKKKAHHQISQWVLTIL